MLSQRRLRRRFAVFDSLQRDASLAISQQPEHRSDDDASLPDERTSESGAPVFVELKHSLEELVASLDRTERQWDTRFRNIEQEMEQLLHRHEDLCAIIHTHRRSSETNVGRLAQVEDEIVRVCTTMTELKSSVDTVSGRIKEHRLEARKLFTDETRAIHAAIHDIQSRIARTDLDMTILRSQHAVDRSQTERVEHALAILEMSDSVLSRSVKRLERDVEDLSERSYDPMRAEKSLAGDPLYPRTLAAELGESDWGGSGADRLSTSSEHHDHPPMPEGSLDSVSLSVDFQDTSLHSSSRPPDSSPLSTSTDLGVVLCGASSSGLGCFGLKSPGNDEVSFLNAVSSSGVSLEEIAPVRASGGVKNLMQAIIHDHIVLMDICRSRSQDTSSFPPSARYLVIIFAGLFVCSYVSLRAYFEYPAHGLVIGARDTRPIWEKLRML
ncbi:hypothetical protein ONZ51_g9907 [Trametes cubensis]|uniref:Uncharacterized protein n=1 Tax=Trametes cubensis TaxID=1111947 RepID=A0AAD7TKG6_9APHY|nr:hypothetical protein ONZ51_g9907 [Trametes cubensis]